MPHTQSRVLYERAMRVVQDLISRQRFLQLSRRFVPRFLRCLMMNASFRERFDVAFSKPPPVLTLPLHRPIYGTIPVRSTKYQMKSCVVGSVFVSSQMVIRWRPGKGALLASRSRIVDSNFDASTPITKGKSFPSIKANSTTASGARPSVSLHLITLRNFGRFGFLEMNCQTGQHFQCRRKLSGRIRRR